MTQSEFIIKPYNMSLDDLSKWKDKFEKMYTKYWKTNPIKRQSLSRNKTSSLVYESIESSG